MASAAFPIGKRRLMTGLIAPSRKRSRCAGIVFLLPWKHDFAVRGSRAVVREVALTHLRDECLGS